MGFLDHSTNNIIIDAVLTDKGRQILASQNGFVITKFALGDTEVDYTIIQQYGRTVGKEKIEKNTPIFEALTNPSLAIPYRMVSLSNNTSITHLPLFTSSPENTSAIDITALATSVQVVTLTQVMNSGEAVPDELIDDAVEVKLNSLFLLATSSNVTSATSTTSTNVATYLFPTSNNQLSFTLSKQSISSATRTAYQVTVGANTYIRTYVTVTGLNSGITKQFEVRL